MSNPRYTAVESQLMISPPCLSARLMPSALLPVAVGPRIARIGRRTGGPTRLAGRVAGRESGAPSPLLPVVAGWRLFVVEERDGKKGAVGWIIGRQLLCRIRREQRVYRGAIERVDA